MQLNLSGHHVDITPALRDYVDNKLKRMERHFENVTNVHVVLEVDKQSHKAEATVHLTGGPIHADAVSDSMYAAIDKLADKLDRQVRRHKEKLTNHHRGEGGLKTLA